MGIAQMRKLVKSAGVPLVKMTVIYPTKYGSIAEYNTENASIESAIKTLNEIKESAQKQEPASA